MNHFIDEDTWDKMSNAEKDLKKERFCGKFPDLSGLAEKGIGKIFPLVKDLE